MKAKDRIIVALDTKDLDQMRKLVRELKDHVGMFKVGLELIMSYGPRAAVIIHGLGGKVMFDPKLADIPTTVGKAMQSIAMCEFELCTVFVPAGLDSMTAAVEKRGNTKIIGVTVLTTMDEAACGATYNMGVADGVLRFADQAKLAGCQGIVCSPQEIALIRSRPTVADLMLVTPGVRPTWAAANDQRRIMTPGEAIRAGADYLVIGRPITNPPTSVGSPVDAAVLIADEIEEALSQPALV